MMKKGKQSGANRGAAHHWLRRLVRKLHRHDWESCGWNGFVENEQFCRKCGQYRHRVLLASAIWDDFAEWQPGRHPKANVRAQTPE